MDHDADDPSTPVKRRYPVTLSRVVATASIPNRSRGSSKQYESLEDLLTAAGYKETRIFTPENDRVRDGIAEAREASDLEPESTLGGPKRLGHLVTNFLSSWMPGASVSLGRAQGAQLARRSGRGSRGSHCAAETPGLEAIPQSPLAHKTKSRLQSQRSSSPSERQGRIRPQTSKSRSRLPSDFIMSNQRQTSVNVNGRTLAQVQNTWISERLQRQLRNANSSPNLKSPRQFRETAPFDSDALPEPPTPRGRRVINDPNRSSLKRPPAYMQHREHRGSHPSKFRLSGKSSFLSTVTPLSPVLNSRDVLCRSTPNSRSTSQVRNSSKHENVPPLPPLLSPEIIDSNLNQWISYRKSRDALLSSRTDLVHPVESDTDDDETEGAGNVLDKILSTRIHRSLSSRSSPSTNESTHMSTSQEGSGLLPPSHNPPLSPRRQHSIQSLRAHLEHRLSKGASNYHRSPHIGETSIVQGDSWLDCPEWSSSRPPMNGRQGSSKRGITPWFGGERAYLDQLGSREDPDWDD
ncbi:uncharacterized protein EI90DRAFT_3062991 [Cantharellus anzutake]|uniref:uncharacterized protein n=1 Tax=Cantharellus anzutake TaxID=1750568 RepID=UPI00190567A3|nr:uncharacterized protein EI90DRAFT_3062991 [Cantharellus anzutake]KAF8329561.1 hypothetical protein EI90DRAFT_3062991 [Cantharellus anzutake]